jgi:hypothetical protein
LAAFGGHYAFEKPTIVTGHLLDIMGIFFKRKLLWVFMPCKAQGKWALQESGPNARC